MKPYYQDSSCTIYHGDCREILPSLPKVDLVLTDPPYSDRTHCGARTNKTENATATYRQGGSMLVTFDCLSDDAFVSLCRQCLAMSRRWVIMTCDHRHAALTFDWEEHVRLGCWAKIAPMPQISGDRPGCGHESVLILHNPGQKRWNGGGKPALWTYCVMKSATSVPSQKPIALIKHILSDFSEPGETILDPFMGSGTTLRAAKDLGRKAIGIEIEERCCEIAARRLHQEVLSFT